MTSPSTTEKRDPGCKKTSEQFNTFEERRELDKTHAEIPELEEKIEELEEEKRCAKDDSSRKAFPIYRGWAVAKGSLTVPSVFAGSGPWSTASSIPPEPRTATKRGRSRLTQDSPMAQKSRCQSPCVVVSPKSMPVAAAALLEMSKPVPLLPGPPSAETPGVPEPPTLQKQVTKTEPDDWDIWNQWEEASWCGSRREAFCGIPPSDSELEAFVLSWFFYWWCLLLLVCLILSCGVQAAISADLSPEAMPACERVCESK